MPGSGTSVKPISTAAALGLAPREKASLDAALQAFDERKANGMATDDNVAEFLDLRTDQLVGYAESLSDDEFEVKAWPTDGDGHFIAAYSVTHRDSGEVLELELERNNTFPHHPDMNDADGWFAGGKLGDEEAEIRFAVESGVKAWRDDKRIEGEVATEIEALARLDEALSNADRLSQTASAEAAKVGIIRALQAAGLGGTMYERTELSIVLKHARDVAIHAQMLRDAAWAEREHLGWVDPQTTSEDREIRLGLVRNGTTTATLRALTYDKDPEVKDDASRYWRARAGKRGELLPYPTD